MDRVLHVRAQHALAVMRMDRGLFACKKTRSDPGARCAKGEYSR